MYPVLNYYFAVYFFANFLFSLILYSKKNGAKNRKLFTKDGHVNFDKRQIKDFDKVVKNLNEYKILKKDPDTDNFFDLLWKMFAVDLHKRISASKCSIDPLINVCTIH